MGRTTHRLAAAAALAALLATTLGLSGCSNRGCTCPDEVEDLYKLRTSPENVLYNLKTAYVDMNLDECIDCLAEEFEFHLNPDDIGMDPGLPVSWGKQDEEDIHENMFAEDSDVDQILLTLTNVHRTVIPGPEPGDPPTWEYKESIDLRVAVTTGDITYLATADQEFTLRIDPLEVGPEGETLWEIVEWHDIDSYGPKDPNRSGEDSSWSGIKALWY